MNPKSNRASFLASLLAMFGRPPSLVDSTPPQREFLGQHVASLARLERRHVISTFGRRQGLKHIKALRREAKLAAAT